ncbi:hypothetical protein QTO34_020133 [Cnephaeus nilssonii]|uniref:Uncharacterized protein n=1 Tax=Cnephaeus nilssonii TaxID=3371016 RepID=A0AA40LNF9_CNENI|nr:hypothetical protein QTO34_020133 [Eptesicus nilssonii]
MHRVVLRPQMRTPPPPSKELAETLQKEQPENVATCIALCPYPKGEVHPYLNKFQLFNFLRVKHMFTLKLSLVKEKEEKEEDNK